MWTELGSRLLALLGAALILYGPARAFLVIDRMPLGLRLAWVAVAIAAAVRPKPSLLAFMAGVPLLATLPSLERWPTVSLGELWLCAVLLAAFARVAFVPSARAAAPVRSADARTMEARTMEEPHASIAAAAPAMPLAASFLLLIVTLSLIVTLYPYQLAAGGVMGVLHDAAAYWRDDFLTAISQRHLYASVTAWATVVEGLALVWLVRWTFRDDPRDVRHALLALCAGGVLVAGIGVYQWKTGAGLLLYWRLVDPYITRINATFTDVNATGAFLAALLVPVWAITRSPFATRTGRAARGVDAEARPAGQRAAAGSLAIRIGATGLVALALLFTASRSAWGAAVAAVFVYWLVLRAKRTSTAGEGLRAWRVPIAAALIAIVALCGLTAYATARNVEHRDQKSYLDAVYYTLNMRLSLNERFKGRFKFWDAALHMMGDRPIAGVGIGRYYKLMPKYLDDAGEEIIQENAHNYFLQMGAELGLIGLLSLLALMGTAVALAIRTAWVADDPAVVTMGAAVAAGVVAFAVTCGTGHSLLLHEAQVTFWPLAAMAWLLDTFYGRGRVDSVKDAPAMGVSIAAPVPARMRSIGAAAAAIVLIATLPIRARAELGRVNLDRVPSGVHDVEMAGDGTSYRWTAARATIHVPREATTLVLPLRSLAPTPQTVTVLRDGRMVDRVSLTDHAWHELRYVLPVDRSDERYYRFDLDVHPTWRPPSDPRDLGVMLGAYRWTPTAKR
jgi:O-antigen ligase